MQNLSDVSVKEQLEGGSNDKPKKQFNSEVQPV